MNKIILEQDKIKTIKIKDNITYEQEFNEILGVTQLKIYINEDSNLELNYDFDEKTKIETQIYIEKNITAKILEKLEGKEGKIRTKYYLKENSNIKVSKFNDVKKLNEYIIINLDGEKSKIDYNLKTIATTKENYDILTYHNKNNTISSINANGICIKNGFIKFDVSSFIPKGIKGCDAGQNNKIINLTDNECIIKPNLYIDEYDVTANHSAWIGNFNEQELFYIMSRGISESDATKLLIKGFLTCNLDLEEKELEKITKKINKYWR